ncbi:helix-turn-helix transcriptional regulator [Melissococcus sp. OM08-11BH]|uniref:helix-turn-helix transcriptional regulator n=1 Tax=Melissococcus sp. OM08-11BH TaxID=2293110 RepID=UPI000E4C23F6|nr:helix-turn-helix transcriptional regulator [Melissococcus sp. OM08-11BH]RGI31856.1 XRE family transcriptional regulator [Melissococcus sp. OM08-11BH]
MNRIKEARNIRGISQNELAKKLYVTQQAISHYENGTRTPDSYQWNKLADLLQFHVEYLKGNIDDPEGFEFWSQESGYSVEELQNEINRMKEANHTTGYNVSRGNQDLIRQAINNLNGKGFTNKGIISKVYSSIEDIQFDLSHFFSDEEKEASISDEDYIPLYEIDDLDTISKRIYDDLDPLLFIKINDIMKTALSELKKTSNNLND